MPEPISYSIPIIGGLFRIAAAAVGALIGRKPIVPDRRLTSRIIESGIIAEFPDSYPLRIVDKEGKQHSGIYIMKLLIWNRGLKTISPADFMDSAPLRIMLSKDAQIIDAMAMSDSKELEYEVMKRGDRSIYFDFDGIGPSDFLSVEIIYSGNPMARVQICGKVRDQSTSLDHEAEDSKASIGERLAAAFMLLLMANMIIGTPISGGLIYYLYDWKEILKFQPHIPALLVTSFGIGFGLTVLSIGLKFMAFMERRKYPPGYPLHLDFEPPFWQGVKHMCGTLFLGEKHRFSTSIFSWAQPVHKRLVKMKRTTIEDWDD